MLTLPKFNTKKELFDYLVENKEDLIYQKREQFKKADGVGLSPVLPNGDVNANKSTPQTSLLDKDVLDAIVIINTTNILDSHKDVHIEGLWDKSLSENKRIKHLQEHKMSFDAVIADKDDLKAYVKTYSWKELGYDAKGTTQALVFESKIRKARNEFMHGEYAKGNVDNHSVGMRYVKIVMCINDEDYGAEKEAWDKYFPMIVNSEEAEKSGYFWAVTEAKCIEGSAVVNGSNFVTPTQEIKTQKTEKQIKDEKYIEAVKNWLAS